MTRIEELMLSAYDLGKEKEMFHTLSRVKIENPKMDLADQYEKAYSITFKTD